MSIDTSNDRTPERQQREHLRIYVDAGAELPHRRNASDAAITTSSPPASRRPREHGGMRMSIGPSNACSVFRGPFSNRVGTQNQTSEPNRRNPEPSEPRTQNRTRNHEPRRTSGTRTAEPRNPRNGELRNLQSGALLLVWVYLPIRQRLGAGGDAFEIRIVVTRSARLVL